MYYCPQCKVDLERITTPSGPIWRCESCEGRAVTLPVVRRLLDRPLVNRIWQSAKQAEAPRASPCPMCTSQCVEVATLGMDQPVHIDVCTRCHTLWFDTHEFDQLSAIAPASEPVKQPPALPQKAREILALAEVELIRERANQTQPAGVSSLPPEDKVSMILSLFGVPVLDDEPSIFARIPLVSFLLAILILAAAGWQVHASSDPSEMFGYLPSEPFRLGGLTLLTYFFFHASWVHWAGNLAGLLIFGPKLEDYLGHTRFLLLIVAATICGALVHGVFESRKEMLLIGASGGLAGILVFFAMRFPKAHLIYCIRIGPFPRWIRINAMVALALWLAAQIWQTYLQLSHQDPVSGLAHLGGAVAGFLWWAMVQNSEGIHIRKSSR